MYKGSIPKNSYPTFKLHYVRKHCANRLSCNATVWTEKHVQLYIQDQGDRQKVTTATYIT